MHPDDTELARLLDQAARGDAQAREALFRHYRERLAALVALHLQTELAARIDPSDVVQEALLDADGKLSDFLEDRSLPFYLWLRRLALDRLADLHRQHLRTQKRSVYREERRFEHLGDDSMDRLLARLGTADSTPSAHARREETRRRVRAALNLLGERDREVLVLRYLEQLSVREIAQVLDISENTVKLRHMRALRRMGDLLMEDSQEQP